MCDAQVLPFALSVARMHLRACSVSFTVIHFRVTSGFGFGLEARHSRDLSIRTRVRLDVIGVASLVDATLCTKPPID